MKTGIGQLKNARRKPIGLSSAQLVAETPIARNVVQFRPAVDGLSLPEWIQANRQAVLDKLQSTGAVWFRNFSLLTIPDFERVLTHLSGELLDYSYRSTPRTQVSGKIYTSTAYPAHQ